MSSSEERDALAKAEALAEAEGLCLVRANSQSGYKGVHPKGRGYQVEAPATVGHHGIKNRPSLGIFLTAAEAALAYARHLGPAECAAAAAKRPNAPIGGRPQPLAFGMPNTVVDQQCNAVTNVVAYADSDDDDPLYDLD